MTYDFLPSFLLKIPIKEKKEKEKLYIKEKEKRENRQGGRLTTAQPKNRLYV